MLPRTLFNIRNSIEDLYTINETTYKRFDSTNIALVVVGKEDTGQIGPLYFLDKLMQQAMKNIQENKAGYSRSDYALFMGASAVNNIIGTYGEHNANKQFLKWAPLFIPEPLTKMPAQIEPNKMTYLLKNATLTYGADLVGITELDRRWVYDRNMHKPFIFKDVKHPQETEEGFIIPNSVNKAVVMAIGMNKDLILESPKIGSTTATDIGYSKIACLTISVAEFIRALGYNAIPCMNDTALSIPLAISAGLGQLGRQGLMITPEFGPCIRICKVLTDMPLNIDKPIDFGITEFCEQCGVCADACPVNAISFDDRTFSGPCLGNNPGVEKWFVDVEKCVRFWQANGGVCSNCVSACPYTADLLAYQCLECNSCFAPNCPIQLIASERLKYGYMEEAGREEKVQKDWEQFVDRKYFSGL